MKLSDIKLTLVLALIFFLLTPFTSLAASSNLLKATVENLEGTPVKGAKLFLYDSPNVRRPADFISNLSDAEGRFQLVLPPVQYWAVARFKEDGKYGPLLPGDKHSGDPLVIDMTDGEVYADFVIADIRELAEKKRAAATDSLRLKGHILDAKGQPVANAYVYANRSKDFTEFPDFISSWSGDDGKYEIYLPAEKIYFMSVSRSFPLLNKEPAGKQLVIEQGKIDIAIDIDFTVD
ncbi:MAG: carboxypeptidase regulatory-like domain-containing protein [Desulfuromonadaceae bacterium]|nr:carboxypeptidase regulatory-like domain-containing protein [Desulfuromonadaceae bacterium]MDD2856169.1 carboxypeptidase regulatory-like domain-containing protein [Desulfuromonadaceae bacterium]